MSPAATRLLPRTQTFQRRRPWKAWWAAVAIAVVVNLGLVLVLSQISNLQVPVTEAPLSVRTIRQMEPDLPPPPPERPPTPPEPEEEPIAVALPTLDLPAAPTPTALSLPDFANLDATFDLPLSVPAFTAIAATTTANAPTGALALGEPDQAAEVESTFDLERFYPRAARLRGITGRSRLRLTIDATGAVANVLVFEATPAGVFEQATERLGHSLRFRPAKRDGKAVASTKDLIIDWTLK
jgi:periplasmic protein TonB